MKKLNFIDVSGYGHSGKTAVSDYIKDFTTIFAFENSVEFELLRISGGLQDLYMSNCESWSLIRSSQALKNFKKIIYRIGIHHTFKNPKSYFVASGHSYDLLFNKKFIEESEIFICNLIAFQTRGYWPYDNFNIGNLELFIRKLLYKITQKHYKSDQFYINSHNFLDLSNEYFQKLFMHVINNEHTDVLLNNACEPYNPINSLNIIGNAKVIIVDRDPRDIYASQISGANIFIPEFEKNKTLYNLKKTMTNFNNVQDFIKRYKILKSNTQKTNDIRVLKVQFEDFILNHDKESIRINEFIGLDITKKKANLFNINDSKKNVGVWKDFKNIPEIKIIEKELSEYCVN